MVGDLATFIQCVCRKVKPCGKEQENSLFDNDLVVEDAEHLKEFIPKKGSQMSEFSKFSGCKDILAH